MRAIGFQQPGGIDRNEALIDVGLPTPKPERRDLLVNVKAVSVNPVDTKKRKVIQPAPGARLGRRRGSGSHWGRRDALLPAR